jgi:hypothetical protein
MATINPVLQTAPPPVQTRRAGGFFPFLGYLFMLLGMLALGVTGIGTFATDRAPMTAWVLMLHVGLSPLFSIGLALMALTWPSRRASQGSAAHFFFWLMLLVGLVVILTGVVPMTPVLGTGGQHLFYLAHRYSAIAFVVVVILHLLSPRRRRTH